MKTPVELLLIVIDVGGRITAAGDKLQVFSPPECPLELKQDIRQHKLGLLKLMRSTFVVAQSRVLGAIVFFVPDEVTKQPLIRAREAGNIYTKAELSTLVARRITPKELRLIHAGKQEFDGEARN
jgi:hypothetical protein